MTSGMDNIQPGTKSGHRTDSGLCVILCGAKMEESGL